jgi:hypothetical protein
MSYRIIATNPQGTAVDRVFISESISFNADLDNAATFEFTMISNWDIINDQTSSNNALQLNSYIECWLNTLCLFRGYIFSEELIQSEGKEAIVFSCLDKYDKYRQTIPAVASGVTGTSPGDITYGRSFTYQTPALQLTSEPLTNIYEFPTTNINFLAYPTSDSAWLPSSGFVVDDIDYGNGFIKIVGDVTAYFPAGSTIRLYDLGSPDWELYSEDGDYYTVISSVYDDITYSPPVTKIYINHNIYDNYGLAYSFASSQFRTNFTILGEDKTIIPAGNGLTTYWRTHGEAEPQGSIKLSQNYHALTPTGIVRLVNQAGDHYDVTYDGYNKHSDGYWYIENVYCAEIATTPLNFQIGNEVQQRIPKRIHPSGAIVLEGQTIEGGNWCTLGLSQYQVNIVEGRFESALAAEYMFVSQDMYQGSTHVRQGYNAFRANYSIYNEISIDVITFNDMIQLIFEANQDEGGMGLSPSQYQIDIPFIGLTSFSVDEPKLSMDIISDKISSLGFDTDKINIISTFYDSQNDILCAKSIYQKDNPDHTYSKAYDITSDFSLEEIYSGIVIKYREPIQTNLAQLKYTFALKDGDTTGSQNIVIGTREAQLIEMDKAKGWADANDTGGTGYRFLHQVWAELLFDGLDNTGWGVKWEQGSENNPGTDVIPIYMWWDDNLNYKTVDKIRIVLDCRARSNVTYPIEIDVLGLTDFIAPDWVAETFDYPAYIQTHPEALMNISGALHYEVRPDNDTNDLGTVILEASGLGAQCQGICVRWNGCPQSTGWVCRIKEIQVFENPTRDIFVKLTNTDLDQGSQYLRADLSYAKLLYDDLPYKIEIQDVGVATRNAALSLGRLSLLQSLSITDQRIYSIPSIDIPILGETVLMPDGFIGVVLTVDFSTDMGDPQLQLRVLSLNSQLI